YNSIVILKMKSTIKLVRAFILANIQYPIRAQVATAGIDVEDPRTVEARGLDFSITLDKSDWLYTVGEPTELTIKLFVDGKPIEAANLSYTIGPEKIPHVKSGSNTITDGYVKLSGGTMHDAGFLLCEVSANI